MADSAIDLKSRLRTEQWKAKGINEVTMNDFKTLDAALDDIDSEESSKEVLEELEERLKSTPRNISALYGASIIKLKNKSVDDSQLVSLLDTFRTAKRWGLLEYLCNAFLRYGENRFILRTLSDCYKETDEDEKQMNVWEKLVKIDFSETDMVLHLAQKYAARGQRQQAIEFYKKLILRSINNDTFSMVQTGWDSLTSLIPGDIEFFLQIENSVGKKFSKEQSVLLLEQLYPVYKNPAQWDNALTILKHIFEYQPDSVWGRKELAVCYREKYHTHRNLDEFLKSSNISHSWRNIHEAIADFEKHVSFDENSFVFHRTWGVGVIREISRGDIVIDFSKNKRHVMSLKMAMTALEMLPKNHIWVLRSVIPAEKLKNMMKENISQGLRIIIQSFDNAVTMKKIRSELVPYVLTESEWVSWNVKARRILKTDGMFGTVADMSDHYEVRAQQSTAIEKMYNSFSAAKDFSSRTKIVLDFFKLPDSEMSDADLELLREVTNYFITFTNVAGQNKAPVRVSAILTLRLLDQKFSPLQLSAIVQKYELASIVPDASVALQIYQQIGTKDMLNDFLLTISDELAEEVWVGAYLSILEDSPSKFVLNRLMEREKIDETVDTIKKIHTNYRIHKEAFIWLVMHRQLYADMKERLPSEEKVVIAMVHLYDINASEISSKRNLSANRKNQKYIQKYLYHEGHLDSLIADGSESVIVQLIPILSELQKIEPAVTINQKKAISERFPHLAKELDQQVSMRTLRKQSGFFTLGTSYHAKQRELQHIHEVAVPENSREIQKALELGDLRENAEYKSAKEHQEILNAQAMRLDNELRQTKVVKPDAFEDDVIGFGSEVLLTDMNENKKVSYTLLGPWESDPGNNVISYLSPLGSKLVGHVKGAEMNFSINDIRYNLRVEDIAKTSVQ